MFKAHKSKAHLSDLSSIDDYVR